MRGRLARPIGDGKMYESGHLQSQSPSIFAQVIVSERFYCEDIVGIISLMLQPMDIPVTRAWWQRREIRAAAGVIASLLAVLVAVVLLKGAAEHSLRVPIGTV